eukprot:CAMPEP_0115042764 /NCGR_PEP_ID=MMETSP0216-20121206/46453_1 /TAXON_ID=223996 /ORGANISM="Protocruzia adherens, Strain Boccale" /LENGTH=725 /DNA_ID=CAMNT_0002424927 /DNA_START=17 /DNA_END=2194 /DNA_ORIENTATION=+
MSMNDSSNTESPEIKVHKKRLSRDSRKLQGNALPPLDSSHPTKTRDIKRTQLSMVKKKLHQTLVSYESASNLSYLKAKKKKHPMGKLSASEALLKSAKHLESLTGSRKTSAVMLTHTHSRTHSRTEDEKSSRASVQTESHAYSNGVESNEPLRKSSKREPRGKTQQKKISALVDMLKKSEKEVKDLKSQMETLKKVSLQTSTNSLSTGITSAKSSYKPGSSQLFFRTNRENSIDSMRQSFRYDDSIQEEGPSTKIVVSPSSGGFSRQTKGSSSSKSDSAENSLTKTQEKIATKTREVVPFGALLGMRRGKEKAPKNSSPNMTSSVSKLSTKSETEGSNAPSPIFETEGNSHHQSPKVTLLVDEHDGKMEHSLLSDNVKSPRESDKHTVIVEVKRMNTQPAKAFAPGNLRRTSRHKTGIPRRERKVTIDSDLPHKDYDDSPRLDKVSRSFMSETMKKTPGSFCDLECTIIPGDCSVSSRHTRYKSSHVMTPGLSPIHKIQRNETLQKSESTVNPRWSYVLNAALDDQESELTLLQTSDSLIRGVEHADSLTNSNFGNKSPERLQRKKSKIQEESMEVSYLTTSEGFGSRSVTPAGTVKVLENQDNPKDTQASSLSPQNTNLSPRKSGTASLRNSSESNNSRAIMPIELVMGPSLNGLSVVRESGNLDLINETLLEEANSAILMSFERGVTVRERSFDVRDRTINPLEERSFEVRDRTINPLEDSDG